MKLSNLKLGVKIGAGFAVIAAILIAVVLLALQEIKATSAVTDRIVDRRVPTSQASLQMLNGINHSLAALRGWIILGADKFKTERGIAWEKEIDASYASMERFSKDWTNLENVKRLERIASELEKFRQFQQEIEDIAHSVDNQIAQKILIEEAAPKASVLVSNITEMIDIELNQPSTAQRKQLLGIMADVRGTTGLSLANIRAYLLTGDEKFVELFNTLWKKNSRRYNDLLKNQSLLTNKQKQSFAKFKTARDSFKTLPPLMFEHRGAKDWNKANFWLGSKAAPVAFKIKEDLDAMVANQQELMDADMGTAKQLIDDLNQFLWVLLGLGLGMSVIISVIIVRMITKPLSVAVNVMEGIASGDLSAKIQITSEDEIGALLSGMRSMQDKLTSVVEEIQSNSGQISAAAAQVSETANSLSGAASEQAASVEQTSASIEEMGASINQNSENASTTNDIASNSSNAALEGGKAVSQTATAMSQIAEKITIIEDIAYQTNMLALNAAIEAARAGEHGKGFAVVAAEVRKLAERSQISAAEISELTSSSVLVAGQAASLLEKMIPDIERTADLVQEISAASEEQSTGADQINTAMQQLDKVTQQNAAGSEQLAATAEEMQAQSENLQRIVGFFRVGSETGGKKTSESQHSIDAQAPPAPRSTSTDESSIDESKFERF